MGQPRIYHDQLPDGQIAVAYTGRDGHGYWFRVDGDAIVQTVLFPRRQVWGKGRRGTLHGPPRRPAALPRRLQTAANGDVTWVQMSGYRDQAFNMNIYRFSLGR